MSSTQKNSNSNQHHEEQKNLKITGLFLKFHFLRFVRILLNYDDLMIKL